MSAEVQPEELEALMGDDASDTAVRHVVAERDFDDLRRLSQCQVDDAKRRVERALSPCEESISRLLRGRAELQLVSTSEVNAEQLFRGASDPTALVRFTADGHPAWCLWESEAAVAAIERMLGASGATAGPGGGLMARGLIGAELNFLVRLLRTPLLQIGASLGQNYSDFNAVALLRQAGSFHDTELAPDPYRMCFELQFNSGPFESRMRLYLPMDDRGAPAGARSDASRPAGLPDHLDDVPVSVAVHLGKTELKLSELLAIEPGDVVPLDSACGKPLAVEVDGRLIGACELGSVRGRRAARFVSNNPEAPTDNSTES